MRNRRHWPVLLGVYLATQLGMGGASAAVITVGPSGANHTTIQAAMNAARPGDEIRVAAGTYAEKVRITTSSLTLLGGWNTGFTLRDPATNITIIDGQSTRRCLVIDGLATTPTLTGGWTIDGFTIRNGMGNLASSDIPGIHAPDPLTQQWLTADDGDFGEGAGVLAYETSGTLSNCRIENCRSGGGVGVRNAGTDGILGNTDDTYSWSVGNGGGVTLTGGGPHQITTCTFQANHANLDLTSNPLMAEYGRNSGGGLRIGGNDAEILVSGCTFRNNTATGDAGGLHQSGADAPITVRKCSFFDNSTSNTSVPGLIGDDAGAARFGSNIAIITVTDCLFQGNTSGDDRGAAMIEGYEAPVYVTNCVFRQNVSRDDIGALNVDDADSSAGIVYVTNCTFDGNRAVGSTGANGNPSALRFTVESGSCYVDRCVFKNNVSTDDGVVTFDDVQWGMIQITNCLFFNNRVLNSGNRLIQVEGLNWVIANCTITSNSAAAEVIRANMNPDTINTMITDGRITTQAWDNRRREVVNCIFANNYSSVARTLRGRGSATYPQYNTVFTLVRNNIFYNLYDDGVPNANPGFYDDNVTAIPLDAPLVGSGNFAQDPLFANAPALDFHLQATSLAIDAGLLLAYVTNDLDGFGRPVGASHDIGAYEYATIPAAPTNLTATPGDASVQLLWNVASGAAGYRIYRSQATSGPYTLVATTAVPSYTVTSLVNGTTYYFVVTAYSAGGESPYSTVASATPRAGISLRARHWSGYK